MRTTPKINALIARPYVRTELQLRFAWCMIGLTLGEYDLEERKRSKVFLMTSVRDLVTQEGAQEIYDRTNFSASIEHLRQDAKRRR